jgi:hypothetical protein
MSLGRIHTRPNGTAPAQLACVARARLMAWPSLALAYPALWPSGAHGSDASTRNGAANGSCASARDGTAALTARRHGERRKERGHDRGLSRAKKGDAAEITGVDGWRRWCSDTRGSTVTQAERRRRGERWSARCEDTAVQRLTRAEAVKATAASGP